MTYSSITIIYNPNSTGKSEQKANELAKTLRKGLKNMSVECIATEYAGHAEDLAYKLAKQTARPLIVSSSGDGGYNEVVNGVIKSGKTRAICAVLPAGNANDHSRTMHTRPLAELILEGKVSKIDVLQVTITKNRKRVVRYAHSYAGLGITPVVAVELNQHSLNPLKEIYIVLKTFLKYQPFEIKQGRNTYKLDSLLFGNINQVAKVFTITPENQPNDGKFEVVSFPSRHKWWLVRRLAQAAVKKLENVSRASSYKFSTIQTTHMQLDGEVMVLEPNSHVTVVCQPKLLNTIV